LAILIIIGTAILGKLVTGTSPTKKDMLLAFSSLNAYNLWRNRCKLVVLFDKKNKKIGFGKLIPNDKGKNYC
jgi:hypothetical protein